MIKSHYHFIPYTFCLMVLVSILFTQAQAVDHEKIPFADGFDLPVGKPNGEGYYLSRGIKGRHLGEDWNGIGGGNTDLGDPVYSVAHGLVLSASDLKMGYGKTVFIVHKFNENGRIRIVETLYAHLHEITVSRGDVVRRGQKVGTIGTGNGLYTAHLHFELRNKPAQFVKIGYRKGREEFLDPFKFIASRRPEGAENLMLVNRPGKFPGRIPVATDTVANKTRFLVENRNVTAPRAGARPVSIDVATPEDGKLAALRKKVTSSLPNLASITKSDPPASRVNREQAREDAAARKEKQPKIETTHLADAITEQKINQELGNLPEVVASKYTDLRNKKDDRVDHFEQHMSNDSLDDPQMSEAALKAERIMITEALKNRSRQGGLIEVKLDQLLLVDESATEALPPDTEKLSLITNPLENKAKEEVSRAVLQVNDTATRLALFLNELSKAKSKEETTVGHP